MKYDSIPNVAGKNSLVPSFESKEGRKMAKCFYCDKSVHFGNNVSHSHRRSNRIMKSNIKRVKAKVDGSPKTIYVCTKCLRSGKVERA